MFASKKNSTPNNPPDSGEKPARWFNGALKWVTALTAIISLFFAVQKVTQTVADNSARTQQISELLRVATMQQQAMDFSRAWDSLAKAAETAGAGDALSRLLDPHKGDIAKIHGQREDLAMAWLANISVPEGQSFSTIVDKLVPVLERGTGSAEPQRKADLLAHIGWSYFLRNRDGHSSFDPAQQYAQAIALDALNPFAHAYWGHWLLWQGDDLDTANAHFAQALQSGRERERVRDTQLVSLNNAGPRGEPQFIATIIEMLNNGEAVADSYRTVARRTLENACSHWGQSTMPALKARNSNGDLVSVYTQLTAHIDNDENEQRVRRECLAALK
ncbi:MAG: hypothetical protein QM709_00410 [Spongiibacteraceae bacterium]